MSDVKQATLDLTRPCTVCGAEVTLPGDAMVGEIVACDDCGSELEVTSLEPLTLAEAPEVAEDWGE